MQCHGTLLSLLQRQRQRQQAPRPFQPWPAFGYRYYCYCRRRGAACTLSAHDAGVSLEIAGHDYTGDKLAIKMALSHMESLVGVYNGYEMGPPSERFGWTFFALSIKPGLQAGIESEFSDMLARYQKEKDRSKRFAMFLSDYFASRNCSVKARVTERGR